MSLLRTRKFIYICLFALLGSILSGCVADRAYRTATAKELASLQRDDASFGAMTEAPLLVEPCKPDFQVPADFPGISLAFAEIDEQGTFRDRKQVDAALNLVSTKSKASGNRSYVVVFVHGWRHDLRWGDENVCQFKQALWRLRQSLDKREDEKNVNVVGVSIGWRGQSVGLFPFDLLTVLDRKSVSEEIGRGALVELLTGLEARTKGLTAQDRRTSPNKLLLVGHSFGASVLHNALGPLLVERLTKDLYQRELLPEGEKIHPDQRHLQGFGDLVVLVNPAIEAMRFLPLMELAHRATTDQIMEPVIEDVASWPIKFRLDENQPPRLLILSSLGDFPTRRVFPVVQSLKTLFEKHRLIDTISAEGKSIALNQSALDTTTVGNEKLLATHQTMVRTAPPDHDKCPRLEENWLQTATEKSGNFNTGRGWSMDFPGSNIRLKHNSIYAATLPIWSMDVSTDIIANHAIVVGGGTLICLFDQLVGSSAAVKKQVLNRSTVVK